MRYIQWDEEGNLSTVNSEKAPVHPRQKEVPEDLSVNGKIMDIKTGELKSAPIPEKSKLDEFIEEWPHERIVLALKGDDTELKQKVNSL